MTDSNRCPQCGGPLPKDGALGGGCPRCMLELGFETSTGGAERSKPGVSPERPAVIGRYRILRLIGEGGMGSVYEAEQDHPRRTVALKIIKSGMASPELLRRFEQESQALGRLQHPGIAQIYEAGTVDTGFGPQPYFAMELIHGRTPRDYAEANHLSAKDRLQMMVKICEAVHHAHQRGLIHRDLKPGNILVDEAGQPKILDFGVVRVTDSDARATLQTDMGQLIGTLAYMSPEQALADPLDLDTRSDVYSLGVILYELLSGRLPYIVSMKIHEAIQAIREEDPARLSTANRTFRGDIETIVAKALEKERERRYASAAEMAADIQRYLNDDPIVARPPSASYQLKKFAHRHRPAVIGIAAVVVVLIAGVAASTLLATRAHSAMLAAVAERNRALEAESKAGLERDRATAAEVAARTQRDLAERAELQATGERSRAIRAEAQARQDRDTLVWQSLARQSIRDSESRVDDSRAALLARQAMLFHGRTPSQPQHLVEEALQQAVRLDPVSRILLPGYETDVASVAVSNDGAHLASTEHNAVRLWDLRNPAAPSILLEGDDRAVRSVAFSPDATRLASASFIGGSYVLLWNVDKPSTTPVRLQGYRGPVYSVAFSPDGTRLASACDDNIVRVWDLNNLSAPPTLFEGHQGSVKSVAFSPNGLQLASASEDKTVRMWDLNTRIAVVFQGHQSYVNSVAFSPDGSRLASASADKTVRVWDSHNPGAPPTLLQGHQDVVNSVAFSRDGSQLASASTDKTVLVWNLSNPTRPVLLQGPHAIESVAFSPDGWLAIAGREYSVRLWQLRSSATQQATLLLQSARIPGVDTRPAGPWSMAFSPDSSRLASASADRTVRLWDFRNPLAPAKLLTGHQGSVNSVVFSPDSTRVASGSADGVVRIWDLRNSDAPLVPLWSFSAPLSFSVRTVVFSSDGARIASVAVGPSTAVRVWNLKNPSATPELHQVSQNSPVVTLSPDLARLAALSSDGLKVWDLRNPDAPPLLLQGAKSVLRSPTFSADSSSLAVASPDGAVVWDLRNPTAPALLLQGAATIIWSVAFSSDRKRLAAGSLEGSVVWDLRSPGSPPVRLISPSPSSPLPDNSIVFSPDGTSLVSGGMDGRVWRWHLWSAAADYLCTRVWRNLSMAEWKQYVGESIPYERTCSALPPGPGAPGSPK